MICGNRSWHRHRLVHAPALNQLHVVALNEGLQRKKALWPAGRNELESSASLFSRRSTVEPDTTGFLSSSATISCSVSCINFSGSVSFTTASHSSRQLSLSDITHPQKPKRQQVLRSNWHAKARKSLWMCSPCVSQSNFALMTMKF